MSFLLFPNTCLRACLEVSLLGLSYGPVSKGRTALYLVFKFHLVFKLGLFDAWCGVLKWGPAHCGGTSDDVKWWAKLLDLISIGKLFSCPLFTTWVARVIGLITMRYEPCRIHVRAPLSDSGMDMDIAWLSWYPRYRGKIYLCLPRNSGTSGTVTTAEVGPDGK